MYKCKLCGNSKEFKERNCYITHLFLEDGEVVMSNDDFEVCIEVICAKCGATSEDESIEMAREKLDKEIKRIRQKIDGNEKGLGCEY